MKVSDEVLVVLDKAQCFGNSLKLVGQLDKKLYTKVNQVLESAGGKWNRKSQSHIFFADAAGTIEQILRTGEVANYRDFDYFPTPPSLVDRLITLADIRKGMIVLEPSAGTGNIAREIAKTTFVDCIELRKDYAVALCQYRNGASVIAIADFLTIKPCPKYDRIVMNPPFKNQADIKHVMHALKFLKLGGRLVSVMCANIEFRQNKLTQNFLTMLKEKNARIESNPDAAFRESGTMVKTVTVVINN